MADTLDLGSSAERREGSSPFSRTKKGPSVAGTFYFALTAFYGRRNTASIAAEAFTTPAPQGDSEARLKQ